MHVYKSIVVAVALLGCGSLAMAQPPHEKESHGGPAAHQEEHGGGAQGHGGPAGHEQPHGAPMAGHGEAHPAPKGYSRVEPPKGWNTRPSKFDKHSYQHNFQAARAFRVGPYHRPPGWAVHHWGFGQVLPRVYFAPEYILSDYWLFSLEVPPAGYEWVRDDSDALLIDINTGEILQVEYGVFG